MTEDGLATSMAHSRGCGSWNRGQVPHPLTTLPGAIACNRLFSFGCILYRAKISNPARFTHLTSAMTMTNDTSNQIIVPVVCILLEDV